MYVLFPMIKSHVIRVIKYIAIILWLYNMRTVSMGWKPNSCKCYCIKWQMKPCGIYHCCITPHCIRFYYCSQFLVAILVSMVLSNLLQLLRLY